MIDSLGDRMKGNYEDAYRIMLPRRLPIILRLDGKSFSSYTSKCEKPYDQSFNAVMNETTEYLCSHIQGAQIAYVQSDEISILINNYKELETEAWLKNNLQKVVSVSAGMASAVFTSLSGKIWGGTMKLAVFDARAFIVPKEEVCNAFLWRQQDATRNSIQGLAQSLFSQKELLLKNTTKLKEMCLTKDRNWDALPTSLRRGRCVVRVPYTVKMDYKGEELTVERSKWELDTEIPIFSEQRDYIEKYL